MKSAMQIFKEQVSPLKGLKRLATDLDRSSLWLLGFGAFGAHHRPCKHQAGLLTDNLMYVFKCFSPVV